MPTSVSQIENLENLKNQEGKEYSSKFYNQQLQASFTAYPIYEVIATC